jgi:hypothetical protein
MDTGNHMNMDTHNSRRDIHTDIREIHMAANNNDMGRRRRATDKHRAVHMHAAVRNIQIRRDIHIPDDRRPTLLRRFRRGGRAT